jgi:WhiB family redox-sensing transcriptional regulator
VALLGEFRCANGWCRSHRCTECAPVMNDGIRGGSKGPRPMTTVLGQEDTVDDSVAVRDAAEPDISGATRDRPGRDPVPRRESRVGPGPLGFGRPSRPPGPGAGRWGWQQRAACQGMDSSRFFGHERERATAGAARIAAAKRVCAGCSVMLECRLFALHSGEPYGVWGGLSEYERAEILESHPPGSYDESGVDSPRTPFPVVPRGGRPHNDPSSLLPP